ncbi:MAG TPA: thioredoxin family protein [Thermoanaerobaculia bacterium]|nr:thioredoxin family protein [Thermoanaerobaculia bacterium]
MTKRKIEIFSAGCPVCEQAVASVQAAACPSCEVEVRSMQDPAAAAAALGYGVRSLPAVVIDGQLASCCQGRGLELDQLRSLGLGQP